jgi:hypothetical protein
MSHALQAASMMCCIKRAACMTNFGAHNTPLPNINIIYIYTYILCIYIYILCVYIYTYQPKTLTWSYVCLLGHTATQLPPSPKAPPAAGANEAPGLP